MTAGLRLRTRVWGYCVGGTLTGILALLYLGGALDRPVLALLDFHFRHFNQVEASDRILMVDINDYALERVHRWPWPRGLHAELITTLKELGARAIVMDIVFAEPAEPRFEHPALSKDADVDVPQQVFGQIQLDDAIHDDDDLVAALRAAGNVYLAMYCRANRPDRPIRAARDAARRVFSDDPTAGLEEFRAALPYDPGRDLENLYHHHRLRHLLVDEFGLSAEQLAARLDTSAAVIDRHLAGAKRLAARDVVGTILAEDPDAQFADVLQRALPGTDYDTLSADREDLLRAFRVLQAWRPAIGGQPELHTSLGGRLQQGWDVTPPLDKLARAACGTGFVIFEPDFDGVLRRIPLVVDIDGRLVPHLGFAATCDLLDIDRSSIRLDGNHLHMTDQAGGQSWRVPFGQDGRCVLNWHLDSHHPDWQHSFEHLPVSRVMEIALNRRTITENEKRWHLALGEAVALACGDQVAQYNAYATDVRRRNQLRREAPTTTGESPRSATDLALIERRIATTEKQALEFLQLMQTQISGLEPESEEERRLFAQVASLAPRVSTEQRERLTQANARLRARNSVLIEQLRPRVRDRICFVGYTAAAVADTVHAPVFEVMPGVLAHANLVNSFLQGRFPQLAPRWLNAVLIVLAGALVTMLTASRGPWVSLISVIGLVLVLLAGSFALFAAAGQYAALGVAVLAVFVCWAFVTLHRQLTEQRARRQFSRALASYTSPAVAARIAEDDAARDLTPRPSDVTCFFSDLQGFTAISERLGAERTRAILNPYLETMSAVLVDHRAIINKFMGDGIFAFFNPPILTCPDHAAAACAAAVDSLTALERLKIEHGTGSLADEVARLEMRIGINTGTVFVGDYGSTNKLDYTCIGDAVNLAARLEPANKFFGTHLLVSQATRAQVSDGFEFRHLGSLQVVGKRQAIPVHELLGRRNHVEDRLRSHAAGFEAAVQLFQDRRWDQAAEALVACAGLRAEDRAARVYLELIERYRSQPPPKDWNRGIELTVK